MSRTLLTTAAILLVPLMAAAQTPVEPVPNEAEALAEWEKVYGVFSHPRCANCHVEGEQPMWSGAHYGATRPHAFNVRRGDDGSGFGNAGMRCTSCHFESNSSASHGPPGSENWHLAPAEMVWFGKSSGYICRQIKDPARNGGRTLDEIAVHVRDDRLVGWGWEPGPGREPAPGSAEETFEALRKWSQAGAPCPPELDG